MFLNKPRELDRIPDLLVHDGPASENRCANPVEIPRLMGEGGCHVEHAATVGDPFEPQLGGHIQRVLIVHHTLGLPGGAGGEDDFTHVVRIWPEECQCSVVDGRLSSDRQQTVVSQRIGRDRFTHRVDHDDVINPWRLLLERGVHSGEVETPEVVDRDHDRWASQCRHHGHFVGSEDRGDRVDHRTDALNGQHE